MHSGMIGKIEKAHRYAEDPSRFAVQALSVTVHGNNGDHDVAFDGASWTCSCEFFEHERTCAHTMALELMLGRMVPASATQGIAAA